MRLEGVVLPVTTPFDDRTGEVAPVSFRENLRAWLEAGVHGFVVAGSTGEAPLLDEDEILRLIGFARDVVPPERLLIVGTGCESTRASVRLSREVAERGADALLVRPPSYFRKAMDAGAIRHHFEQIADSSPIPIILYHVPQFVPVEITPAIMAELCSHANIIGIKDSTGDLKSLAAFLDAAPAGASVMVGAGSKLYAALELGAAGGIIAVGCIAPQKAIAVYGAFREGAMNAAGKAQDVLTGPHNEIVRGVGVAGVKYALDLLGYSGGDPRSPLRPLNDAARATVRAALKSVDLV